MHEKSRRNKTEKKSKTIAINEILILIISIIAFSYLMGSSLPVVAGVETAVTGTSEEGDAAPPPPSSSPVPVKESPPSDSSSLPTTEGTTGATAAGAVSGKVVKKVATSGFKEWLKTKFGTEIGYVLEVGLWSGAVAVVLTFIITWAQTGDVEKAAWAAARAALGAGAAIATAVALAALGAGPPGWVVSAMIAIGVWLSNFLAGDTDRDIFFESKLWQPQTGGANCRQCNNGLFPCTEYQCRSLGAGCELMNKETSDPLCVFKDTKDVNSPEITAWTEALQTGYRYDPIAEQAIRGVDIKYADKECLPAFTPFSFGIEIDKEGYCKLEDHSTRNYSEMRFDFGGINYVKTEFVQWMSFPGVVHLEKEIAEKALNVTNDGKYEYYVRCEAASSGAVNIKEFLFRFCIDSEDDINAPIIRGFDPRDRTPIGYFSENQEKKVPVRVYTNEPAQCRWEFEDKNYADMEHPLNCPNSVSKINSQLTYTCTGNLTGLMNNQENKFFFRCNDTFGNVNTQSASLTLLGTEALYILKIEPNATTIKGGTSPLKVTLKAETSAGADRGNAICGYRNNNSGISGQYTQFTKTETHQHESNLWFDNPGNYGYFIRCSDDAGNSDTKEISFNVELDTSTPIVVRAFRENQNFKLITNEDASCVYDTFDCNYNFEDGIEMDSNGRFHIEQWNPNQNFYIKCMDEFGNRPLPNQCSIIINPFEI